MVYVLACIGLIFISNIVSNFIQLPNIKHSYSALFLKQFILLTSAISLYAIYHTQGKTIMLIVIPAILYLVSRKELCFKVSSFKSIKENLYLIIFAIPLIIFQYYLFVDFNTFKFFSVSEDILFYGNAAKDLTVFGFENTSGLLNEIYPQLFDGIAPYHYYELWFTSIVAKCFHLSHTYSLVLIVYSYLVYLLYLGIVSVFQLFNSLRVMHFLLGYLLLFVGPLYMSSYVQFFNDGNFFDTSVFITPGFVKQTLAYSFYGQKHLPVYLFGIAIFYFLFQKKYDLFFLFSSVSCIAAFGIIPGVIGAVAFFILLFREQRTKRNIVILLSAVLFIGAIYQVLGQNISKELSNSTFYFQDFLKILNLKGEIARVIAKYLSPVIWFSILYAPIIIFGLIYRKVLQDFTGLKPMLLLVFLLLFVGASFTLIVKGIDSDQFLTNLLPFLNIFCIYILVFLFSRKWKAATLVISLFFIVNLIFILNYYNISKKTEQVGKEYSQIYIDWVIAKLNKEGKVVNVAYLLDDSTLKMRPPVLWYAYSPGRYFVAYDFINLININDPNIKYPVSYASSAFSASNQMRFYFKKLNFTQTELEDQQIKFLKEFNIKYLIATKNTNLSEKILMYVKDKKEDDFSSETFYVLDF